MSKVSMFLNAISLHKKLMVRAAQIGVRNISISNALRKSHYETLGVPRDATQAEIKNAYFELSKLYHPDRIAATDENLAKFREVSAAYEILGNEQSRRLYDRGMLGDFKRPGEEEEQITDPIIKFYKQRQEVTKFYKKADDDVDAWSKTYFKEARQRVTKQHHVYKTSEREQSEDHPMSHPFAILMTFLFAFVVAANFEGTKADKIVKKVTCFKF